MYVHVFGAFCGITVTGFLTPPFVSRNKTGREDVDNQSRYNGEMWSWLGGAFLWVFWPTFNAIYAPEVRYLYIYTSIR